MDVEVAAAAAAEVDHELQLSIRVVVTVGRHYDVTIVQFDPQWTVAELLSAVCHEAQIDERCDFELRTPNYILLQKDQTLRELGVGADDSLVLSSSDKDAVRTNCTNWWCLFGIGLLLAAGGMVGVIVAWNLSGKSLTQYGVIIDAGSTHSQLYVYQWSPDCVNGTGIASQLFTCRPNTGGISGYRDDPSQAGPSLQHCLDEAASMIPSTQLHTTPLFLGATAGMRLLNDSDPLASYRILESVGQTLRGSKFKFDSAKIISGVEEGTSGWISANYLEFGSLIPSSRSYGALDLGGASAEITFQSNVHIPSQYDENVTLFGNDYSIYSESALCYGIKEAERNFFAHLIEKSQHDSNDTILNPCATPRSEFQINASDIFMAPCVKRPNYVAKQTTFTFIGTGSTTLCNSTVHLLFNYSKCGYNSCSFNGAFLPPVEGRKFLAFSAYFTTMSFFNQSKSIKSLTDFKVAVRRFCTSNETEEEDLADLDNPFLLQYCFSGFYVLEILENGYGFNDANFETIQFVKSVGSSELGWTLGFVLNATNYLPEAKPTQLLSLTVFCCLVTLFSVLLIITLFFLVQAVKVTRYSVYSNYHSFE